MRRVILACAFMVAIGGIASSPAARTSVRAQTRPNILLILTDDQPGDDTLGVMPNTTRIFGGGGTRFRNFYATTPLCCPSRGSFWSGRYAHNHGVTTNNDLTKERRYDQSTTIQSSLRASGYTTALVGKYWWGWPLSTPPPSFDRWAMFAGGYTDASFNINGTRKVIPGYTTAVIGDHSLRFLQAFEANDDEPWFMYVTPQAPHAPYVAAAAYADAPVPPWNGNPAVFETDRSDKPPAVRRRSTSYSTGDAIRTRQLRTLMSVDDVVNRIFARMGALGETQNTLAFFTSDNGFMWGEHKIADKRFPYRRSANVPLYVRWPGHVARGAISWKLTANIDVAPTILEAAGLSPATPADGRSLFSTARSRLLLEYFKSPESSVPAWASTLTTAYQYTEWYDGAGTVSFREYYDLAADPWQLANLFNDGIPSNDPSIPSLRSQLATDRICTGAACP